jgi:hypothetical protein
LFVVLFASTIFAACTESSARAAKKTQAAGGTTATDSAAPGSVNLGSGSYTPSALGAIGSISGIIKLDGAVPRDSNRVTTDLAICGLGTSTPVQTAATGGIASAIVWIADVKTGKALPIEKREQLESERCELEPRVQAAVVGTTVNVINDDKLLHRLAFIRLGTHDTLTVTPFFNAGQLVASERIAKRSGIVEVRCAQHPWTRGYIAVFRHPYFAVTGGNGEFRIDSLPAGAYKMMVWHEGMDAPKEEKVQVAAGGEARVVVGIGVGR